MKELSRHSSHLPSLIVRMQDQIEIVILFESQDIIVIADILSVHIKFSMIFFFIKIVLADL